MKKLNKKKHKNLGGGPGLPGPQWRDATETAIYSPLIHYIRMLCAYYHIIVANQTTRLQELSIILTKAHLYHFELSLQYYCTKRNTSSLIFCWPSMIFNDHLATFW